MELLPSAWQQELLRDANHHFNTPERAQSQNRLSSETNAPMMGCAEAGTLLGTNNNLLIEAP